MGCQSIADFQPSKLPLLGQTLLCAELASRTRNCYDEFIVIILDLSLRAATYFFQCHSQHRIQEKANFFGNTAAIKNVARLVQVSNRFYSALFRPISP